jgi:hypothetical protein
MGSILPQLFLVIKILEIDFSIINIKFNVLLSVPFAKKCNFLKIAIWNKCTFSNGLLYIQLIRANVTLAPNLSAVVSLLPYRYAFYICRCISTFQDAFCETSDLLNYFNLPVKDILLIGAKFLL